MPENSSCSSASTCSRESCEGCPSKAKVGSGIAKEPMNKASNVKKVIGVVSGKGGVGKSTVSANIAEAFQKEGFTTGILDADIHGPNIPKMLGVEDQDIMINEERHMMPVEAPSGLKVMSMAFMLDSIDTPIIWRGPQKTGSIKQLIADVAWGPLDVLIIDNPPGTGDEPLTVLQTIPDIDAVVMVTTPNVVSQEDVLKCVKMVEMLNVENIGLVENMAYYECPHCNEKLHIFGKGDGKDFADEMEITYLGDLPLTEKVSSSPNKGGVMVTIEPKSDVTKRFTEIVNEIQDDFFKKED